MMVYFKNNPNYIPKALGMTRIILLLSIGITYTLFMSCTTPRIPVATAPDAPVKQVAVPEVKLPANEVFLNHLFAAQPASVAKMLAEAKNNHLQVIFTQINRSKNGNPTFTEHHFNTKHSDYFYPASTVKFPIVLLALEKLKALQIPGLDRNSTMITDAGTSSQTAVYNDPNTANGQPSIASYIKKILLVSDNDAYNRLYEFLGQDYINQQLFKKGYRSAEIHHRLGLSLSMEENRYSNPIQFFDTANRLLYQQPLVKATHQYPLRQHFLGKGYMSNGQLVNQPMNFSEKNKISLSDLNAMLKAFIFPDAVPAAHRFDVSEEDRRFVLQYMSQYPAESAFPSYDADTYYNAFAKFLLFGSEKGPVPPNIRLFNKVGNAYGQLTDMAYIVDFATQTEFMLSATIYCNEDGILNDDKYDYDRVGFPILKELGMLLLKHEQQRKKNHQPYLVPVQFTYDK
jgi:beta-lactamase class A